MHFWSQASLHAQLYVLLCEINEISYWLDGQVLVSLWSWYYILTWSQLLMFQNRFIISFLSPPIELTSCVLWNKTHLLRKSSFHLNELKGMSSSVVRGRVGRKLIQQMGGIYKLHVLWIFEQNIHLQPIKIIAVWLRKICF